MAYDDIINAEAQRNQVDPDLLRAMMRQESGGNPTAVSKAGASGLMQLMPATAKELGVSNIFDPQQNIAGGAKYVRQLIDKYGNVDHAVQAYNVGPGRFDKFLAGEIKSLPQETVQYGDKVSANFANLKKGVMPQQNSANVDAWLGQSTAPTGGVQSADAWLGGGAAPVQAQPVAAQVATQQAPAQRSAFDETARQVGLTGRAAVTGLTALPTMAGDALNSLINMGIGGVNRVAGTSIPQLQMPSAVTQQAMNAAGIPQPQSATERVVQDVAGAMAGTGGQFRLGQALLNNVPAAAGVGRALTTAPVAQIAGAAGGAGAQGTAREEGAGIGGQLGASLLGSAAPILAGSAATALVRGMQSPARVSPIRPERAPEVAADTIRNVARETSTAATPEDAQTLAAAIQRTPTADPKALARQMDFQELGIEPTLGQLTRNPAQYSREKNIRGLQGVGDPLLARMATQNNQLQEILGGFRGQPMEKFQAGEVLTGALKQADDAMSRQINEAYAAARQSTGKDLSVPLQGVAQKYAEVLKDFGDKVPSGVRNNFNELGLLAGTQRRIFTIEDADRLTKTINANYSTDPATNRALGELLKAVKGAVLEADPKGGPFAPAVALAKQRFSLHDAVPALNAAAQGTTAADDFVKRFVINGKTKEVHGLADILRKEAPDAFAEARSQIGNELNRGAFGTNVTGDKQFAPERFAETMQRIGSEKLKAFFTPEEVATLHRIGRVGSYINVFPASSTVNTSHSGVVAANLMGRIPDVIERIPVPGSRLIGNLARSATKGMEERDFVAQALAANLGKAGNRMTPEQAALASQLLLQPAVRVPPVKP